MRTGMTRPPGMRPWPRCWACSSRSRRSSPPPRTAILPGPACRWRTRSGIRMSTAPARRLALRRGVAKDRRISVEDSQMRHGRKSRSVLFDGYKRHLLRDLTPGWSPRSGSPGQRAGGQRHRRHRRRPGRGRADPGRAAYRPGLPVLGPGPRPRPGPGDLLQSLAGPQRLRPVRQGPVHPRLQRRAADLPRRGCHAVRARQDRALPERHLRGLPAAAALHLERGRAQREPAYAGTATGMTTSTGSLIFGIGIQAATGGTLPTYTIGFVQGEAFNLV